MGWMAKMADRARELLGIPKGGKGRRVSVMPAALVKSEEEPSHGELAKCFRHQKA